MKSVDVNTAGDLIKRSDLRLRPNFGLTTNLHKFSQVITTVRSNLGDQTEFWS